MKIGNITIKWHKHNWKKEIITMPFFSEHHDWVMKIAEKCADENCDVGYYRSVYWLHFKTEPEPTYVEK